MKLRLILLSFLVLILSFRCKSQTQVVDRQPYAGGRFFPENSAELTEMLQSCFSQSIPNKSNGETIAIISPHAGYVFSGIVAASAFNQINPEKEYKNIFILGVSHRVPLRGASIYSIGNYLTPLGEIKVNSVLAENLIDNYDVFEFNNEAHAQEHSVEVQVPFLQHIMKSDYKIIPIVIGGSNLSTCQKIANALQPYFNEENLFIISTDFSHYPEYETANKIDKETAAAIESNSVDELVKVITDSKREEITNLGTSMCGWPAVFTLLFMSQHYPEIEIKNIQYMNSGDSSFGNKDQVVGYHAFSFSLKSDMEDAGSSFRFKTQEKIELLGMARNTIEKYLAENEMPKIETDKLTANMLAKCGAFVTLKKNGQLRGCIGRFITNDPLYKVIQQMAVASATQDYRFQPVSKSEIDILEIEISVLSPMRRIDSIEEFELGKHGIYIIKGNKSGTFLPQVADETGWTKEEFIGHCSRDKTGIGWDGWKEADLYIYEAYVFSESEIGIKSN